MHRRTALAWVALLASAAAAAPAADLASIVPEDVLFYAEVSDPKGIWADFEQSGLRDILAAVPQVEMQFRMACGIVLQAVPQRLGVPWDDLVTKFLSRFALVFAEGGGPGRLPVLLLDASATKAELAKLLKDTIEPSLARAVPDQPPVALADEEHGGIALRVLKAPGGTMAYAFIGDVFALAEPPALKRLIDGRARRPLSTNAAFLAARKTMAGPRGIVAFLNLGQVLADHRPVVEGNPELQRLLGGLGLTTAKWVAFSSRFEGRGVRDRVLFYTGERKMGLVRLLSKLSAGTSAAAQFLPKDCPILVSLNFKDGPELWQGILKFLEEGGHAEGLARLDEGKQTVLWQFGINFEEDLVGALGGELFIAANPDFVAEHAAKRRAPRNEDFAFILGFRVAKPDALKTTIHRAIAAQPGVGQAVERKTETYQDIEISSLVLPDAPNRPAYAFVGDFLLVAKSAALIRQCIDAKAAGGAPLAAAARYRNVADAMPLKHHGIVYADLQDLLTAMLTGGQAPAEDQPIAAPRRVLADLAGQLRGACATVSAGEQGVVIETYSRAGLIPLAAVALSVPIAAPAAAPAPQPPTKGPKATDF